MLLKKGILKPKEEAAKTKASFDVSPPGGIVGEAICVCQFLHRGQRRKWLQSERAFGLNCPRETPRQPLPILGSTSQALPSEAGQTVEHLPPAKHTQKQKHILHSSKEECCHAKEGVLRATMGIDDCASSWPGAERLAPTCSRTSQGPALALSISAPAQARRSWVLCLWHLPGTADIMFPSCRGMRVLAVLATMNLLLSTDGITSTQKRA